MSLLNPTIRILALPILRRLLLILAVIEAIFLAESFTTLLEETLRHNGVAADVFILLLFKTPEILDLALAIGMLVAVFFVVTDARNRGEMLILASSGVRWSRIIRLVLFVGCIGGLMSFVTAGVLWPMTKYAGRLKMADIRADYIVSLIEHPGPQSSGQTIRNVTFVATPPADNAQRRGQLFVFQPDINNEWRALQSRNWNVSKPDQTGQRLIKLEGLSAYQAPYPDTNQLYHHVSTFNVEDADFAFRMSDVTTPPHRSRSKTERILGISSDEAPRITRLTTRALMVPMAALLALAAIIAGGAGLGRFMALPLAALTLLTSDVLARSLLASAIETVSAPFLFVLATLIYLGPPLTYLILKGEALMFPSGRRT